MKLVKIKKIVVEEKYKASDGELFDSKRDCEAHEEVIEFNTFPFNANELTKKLSLKNYKHYIYNFIHQIYKNPFAYRKELQNTFEDIASIKKYFCDSILNIKNEEEFIHNEYKTNRYNRSDSNNQLKTLYAHLYTSDFLIKAYDFLFNTLELKISDLESPVYSRDYHDDTKRGLEYSKKDKCDFYSNIFFSHAHRMDSIKGFEFLTSVKELDIQAFFKSFEDTDFILKIHSHHYNNNYISKQIKWIQYIIESDFDYKFYITPNKKKIYLTLEEAINYTSSEEVKAILHTAGSNIVSINKRNKKSDFLFLTNEVIEKLKSSLPPLSNNERSGYRFSKQFYIWGEDKRIEFYPEDITDDKKNVNTVVISYSHHSNNKTSLPLTDYIGKADLLAEKILFLLGFSKGLTNKELTDLMDMENKVAILTKELNEKVKEFEKMKRNAIYGY